MTDKELRYCTKKPGIINSLYRFKPNVTFATTIPTIPRPGLGMVGITRIRQAYGEWPVFYSYCCYSSLASCGTWSAPLCAFSILSFFSAWSIIIHVRAVISPLCLMRVLLRRFTASSVACIEEFCRSSGVAGVIKFTSLF